MVLQVLLACTGLVTLGVGLLLLTRRPVQAPPPDTGTDPWAVFGPRSDSDIDPRRRRMWPYIGAATVLVAVVAGAALMTDRRSEPPPVPTGTPPSVIIAFQPTPEPPATPEVSPTPSTTPIPAPGSTPAPGSASATGRAPGGVTATRPAATTAPTPPPKPGPSVGASVSCFNRALNLNYSANARPGTTLASMRIALDGATVQQPSVSGRTQHSGSYQRSGSAGSHTFTVTATGSDGGSTTRTFPVTCS